MGAREDMLAALRRAAPGDVPLPDLSRLGVRFDDPVQTFIASVSAVGGSCLRVADAAAARRAVAELDVVREAKKIVSLVATVAAGNVDLAALADAHQLEGLDVAILPGELGVAENGAVWVDGAALHHRAVFVIPEHLILVASAREIVDDMHAAYARLGSRTAAYGVFIAGPSKTADIEQALVIGAHGPRSCTVVLIGP